ncbi:uncharacterized protein EV420DRAFT_1479240 [Desarmillaria tabescens]|uniref:Uncharacterized protein n=1 Tax=Armillaria tabescens TaxID=1929756 RepID=A0AA39N6H9_ARMTA|nr:uncharacterized protein EV420DRAFT_1479240 [Desarmillaria tabescens]KAK0459228.1 hypothetical protein EV420DRAFT_1479240 [Desarmillaria tabescens]
MEHKGSALLVAFATSGTLHCALTFASDGFIGRPLRDGDEGFGIDGFGLSGVEDSVLLLDVRGRNYSRGGITFVFSVTHPAIDKGKYVFVNGFRDVSKHGV